MPKQIELELRPEELGPKLGALLDNRLFHFTSGEKLKSILQSESILPNTGTFAKTSIHSDNSMGRHLGAVCLFDLRNKTAEQIAPGKSYYDYLAPRTNDSMVYLILSDERHTKITTLKDIDVSTLSSKMYLPEIESWHVGPVSLQNIEQILVVRIID